MHKHLRINSQIEFLSHQNTKSLPQIMMMMMMMMKMVMKMMVVMMMVINAPITRLINFLNKIKKQNHLFAKQSKKLKRDEFSQQK